MHTLIILHKGILFCDILRKDQSLIEVKNITKTSGFNKVLDNVSFTVMTGKVTGILGDSKAGKTSLLDVIAGISFPREGSVCVDGVDINKESRKMVRQIGYLPADNPMYPEMTVQKFLDFLAVIKGVRGSNVKELVRHSMFLTGIEGIKDKVIRELLPVEKLKTGLAGAMLGSPSVLLLDEPFSGLGKKELIEAESLVTKLSQNRTVIISFSKPHLLPDICEEIVILNKGHIAGIRKTEDVMDLYEKRAGLYLLARGSKEEVTKILSGLPGIVSMQAEIMKKDRTLVLLTSERKDLRETVFRAFADSSCTLIEMNLEPCALQSLIDELEGEGEERNIHRTPALDIPELKKREGKDEGDI